MKCVNVVIGFEGGYVNDKDDKGGETNYGITASTLNSAKTKDGYRSTSQFKT